MSAKEKDGTVKVFVDSETPVDGVAEIKDTTLANGIADINFNGGDGVAPATLNHTGGEVKGSGILATNAAQSTWNVEDVVASLPGGAPQSGSESPIAFFHMLTRLKTTKREGWVRFGIPDGESISDHMYRMAMITMFPPASLAAKINIPHCMKMALVHDMAEALVGDITPVDGIAKHEKSRRESTTMDYFAKKLLGNVGGGMAAEEMRAIWQEYEDSKTVDSHFVHDVDKIELMLQMIEYERAKEGTLDLGEFTWVASRIALPEVKEWANEILNEREEFWATKPHSKYDELRLPEAGILAQKLEYYGNGKE